MKKFLLFAMALIASFAVYAQSSVWNGEIPAADAEYAFSGGDGSAQAPYQISSAADLAQLAANVNNKQTYADVNFVLTDNIVLNSAETAHEWPVIGLTAAQCFSGVLDGAGYAIEGMKITVRNNYSGLFGFTKDATIKNLYVTDVDVNVDVNNVMCAFGILAGDAQGTLMLNCATSGSVKMHLSANKSAYVGGFVGMGAKSNTSGNGNTIVNCYSTAEIVSTVGEGVTPTMFYSAGISGQVNGTITNCYYGGKMTYNYTPAAKVFSSAIAASINGTPEVSGNYYALAEGSSDNIFGYGTSENNTAAEDVSDLTAAAVVEKLNAGAETLKATYAYVVEWAIANGAPAFATEVDFEPEPADGVWDGVTPAANAEYAFSGGDGSAKTPYQIATAADLAQLAANVNNKQTYADVNFVLTDNIVLNSAETAHEWPVIGLSTNQCFSGSLDGGGNAIKGLKITVRNNYAGLFGFTKDAVIESLNVTDVNVNVDVDNLMCAFGIIAGDAQGTVIKNCSTSGSVKMHISANKSAYVGGFVGMGAKSNGSGNGNTIINCHSSADISSTVAEGVAPIMFYSAGISGQVNGLIQNCYYDGKMTYNYTPTAKVYSSAISANPNGSPEVKGNFYALADGSSADICGVSNSSANTGAEDVSALSADEIVALLNSGAEDLGNEYGKILTWANADGQIIFGDRYTDASHSAIHAIENDSNAPAVYYNLQGVRVANPVNGIYVKVCGGKATKVLVK